GDQLLEEHMRLLFRTQRRREVDEPGSALAGLQLAGEIVLERVGVELPLRDLATAGGLVGEAVGVRVADLQARRVNTGRALRRQDGPGLASAHLAEHPGPALLAPALPRAVGLGSHARRALAVEGHGADLHDPAGVVGQRIGPAVEVQQEVPVLRVRGRVDRLAGGRVLAADPAVVDDPAFAVFAPAADQVVPAVDLRIERHGDEAHAVRDLAQLQRRLGALHQVPGLDAAHRSPRRVGEAPALDDHLPQFVVFARDVAGAFGLHPLSRQAADAAQYERRHGADDPEPCGVPLHQLSGHRAVLGHLL